MQLYVHFIIVSSKERSAAQKNNVHIIVSATQVLTIIHLHNESRCNAIVASFTWTHFRENQSSLITAGRVKRYICTKTTQMASFLP